MISQNLLEKQKKINTQDLESTYAIDIPEKIQTQDRVLVTKNEENNTVAGLEKPTLFERLSILGLVLFGGIAVYSFPQNLEQRNKTEQTPTTVQNIQKLRSNHSNTVE
jgi:hypothetical protein